MNCIDKRKSELKEKCGDDELFKDIYDLSRINLICDFLSLFAGRAKKYNIGINNTYINSRNLVYYLNRSMQYLSNENREIVSEILDIKTDTNNFTNYFHVLK